MDTDRRIDGACVMLAATFSDSNEFTLTDSTGGDARQQAAAYARGFHANIAGTLSVVDLNGNTASLVVTAGALYPYKVKKFRVTGTDAGIHNTSNSIIAVR